MKKHLAALALLLAATVCANAATDDTLSVATGGLVSSQGDKAVVLAPQASKTDDVPQPYVPSAEDSAAATARATEIDKMLEDWGRLSPDEAAARFGVAAEDVTHRIETLTSLKNAYPRIVNAMSRKQQEDAELSKQKTDTNAPELELTDKPPYSLTYHDSYIGTMDDIRKQSTAATDALKRATAYAESSQQSVEAAEAAWRLARDNYTKDNTPPNQWKLQSAGFDLESARTQLIFDTFIKERAAIAVENYDLQLARRQKLQDYICSNLDLTEEGYNAQTALINEQVKKLEDSRPALSRDLRKAETAASQAEYKYSAAKNESRAAAKLEYDYRIAERDRARLALEQMQETLVLLATRKRLWSLRYELARGSTDKTTIPDTIKKMNADAVTLNNNVLAIQKVLLSLQARQSSVEKQITDAEGDKSTLATQKKLLTSIQAAIDICLTYAAGAIAVEAQERHFVEELQTEYKTVGLVEKTSALWKARAVNALNTELWQSGGYAVRLREFLIALAIITLGSWGARKLVYMLSWAVAKYFKFDETSRRTFNSFMFFFAFIAIFLTALHIVGIPLTAFAFLGGTVAIAIGFGAQNMFKNLMGGILLTLNRPFRIGDVIEVGGVSGTVTNIGVRSTLIRTFDEKDVIVPNSQLIDNQMTNWSLNDTLLRVNIPFGVEYGSSPALVRETVLKIVAEQNNILSKPEPWVCFTDFGDNDLQFTLYYWINQRVASGARTASVIRERMLEEFDKVGLAMAYPHMDVNIYKNVAREMPPQERG